MITVTEWFRTPRMWHALADHVATLQGPVIGWSGACGSGEEAYSLAVLLDGSPGARVLASDVDPGLIKKARAGRYTAAAIETALDDGRLTASIVERFLYRDPVRGRYHVRDQLRERVAFGVAAVGTDAPPSCHLALIRNCWRYLDATAQARALSDVHAALLPGGRLVIGGADLIDERNQDVEPAGLAALFTRAEHALIWRPRTGKGR